MTDARKGSVLRTVLLILSLPPLLALVEAEAFHRANRDNAGFVSSGEERSYLLYVPRSYDRAKPAPLVISLHGAGLWGAAQRDISLWNEEAEREGLILVYPSGLGNQGPRVWHADGGFDLSKDVRFISELIDTLSASYSIDPNRIYANGLSNGGGMSFVLSCTLSNRIAAVGMVGAAHLLPWNSCTDRKPVPAIAFHGTADNAAPYDGGMSWVADRPFPSIPGWTAKWAQRNGCASTPVESSVAADVVRIEYPKCDGNAAVVLYRIEGGGHTWPGGGPLPKWFTGRTSRSIDATAVMWQFFRKHPLIAR
jgi:polyhydroxybutyrate depolymerase